MAQAKNYKFLWSNAHQLFYMRPSMNSYANHQDVPFNSAKYALLVSHGNKMTCYVSEECLEDCVSEGDKFLQREFAVGYIEKAKKQCAVHQAYYKKLVRIDYSKCTNSQLLNSWRELMDHYAHSAAYFRSTQEESSRALVNAVAKVVSPEELNILLLSPKLDEINKEAFAWQKLVASGFSATKALRHLYSFPWLFQNTLTYEEAIVELKQRASKPTFRDFKKEKLDLQKAQSKILKKYPKIKDLVKTLQELALLRPLVKSMWASTGFYATPLLNEISRRFGENPHALTFVYGHEDIERLLEAEKLLSKKELDDRKLCTVYMITDGKLSSFTGSKAEAMERKILGKDKKINESNLEIKGMSAHPGKLTGVVHILSVNDPESTRKFRQSFKTGVLITCMTQPNVMDIAERASAIITDEGGMLSHAAVISREFRIPCIVGTGNATKVFKDGDMVEVDANKGTVKRLS